MQDRRVVAQARWVPLDGRQQVGGLDVVPDAQRGEVLPLFGTVEHVGDDDVLHPAAVQFPDQGAPDKAGSAGDEDPPVQLVAHPGTFGRTPRVTPAVEREPQPAEETASG